MSWKQKLRVFQLRLSQLRVQGSPHSLLNLLSDGSLCLQSSQTHCTPATHLFQKAFCFGSGSTLQLCSCHTVLVWKAHLWSSGNVLKHLPQAERDAPLAQLLTMAQRSGKGLDTLLDPCIFQVQNLAQSSGKPPIEHWTHFQIILIFHGFHRQSSSFANKEVRGARLKKKQKNNCVKLLWKTSEDDGEEAASEL